MTDFDPFPSVYIGHGAPLNILWSTKYRDSLLKFVKKHQTPRATIVVSAHWEKDIPLQITSAPFPEIIYDYYGFPQEMYELKYTPPGDPKLANKIAISLNKIGVRTDLNLEQGLDHGAWIPLKIMYPEASIPILQLSIPIPRNANYLYKIGQTLKEYKNQGVMLMGSGNLIHNLPHVFKQIQQGKFTMDNWANQSIEPWAGETDKQIKEMLDDFKIDELLNSKTEIMNFKDIAPTSEHFDPLYFVLGTLGREDGISYIHEGFEGGSISMRSFMSEA